MATTLTLISHGSTEALRRAAFPADEPLERFGARDGARARERLRRFDRAWVAPELRARQTAAALGIEAAVEPALRDLDSGSWAGKGLAEIAPQLLAVWLNDTAPPPHGGETVTALIARVADWMKSPIGEGHCAAVTHPAILRAAIVHAIGADASAFRRIDVAPLDAAVLSFSDRWRFRSLAPLAEPSVD